jgi:hypothetical protein
VIVSGVCIVEPLQQSRRQQVLHPQVVQECVDAGFHDIGSHSCFMGELRDNDFHTVAMLEGIPDICTRFIEGRNNAMLNIQDSGTILMVHRPKPIRYFHVLHHSTALRKTVDEGELALSRRLKQAETAVWTKILMLPAQALTATKRTIFVAGQLTPVAKDT